ncbi:hypothetical protein Taro_022038 [Colocasia esculenta]|uniref:Cystinosin homolog n=1 Tax=Colocasia esculenta TaxID=4460 RepID=A0A843UT95_COLES|nr:hypothetical protein [Colocasia esculenta]
MDLPVISSKFMPGRGNAVGVPKWVTHPHIIPLLKRNDLTGTVLTNSLCLRREWRTRGREGERKGRAMASWNSIPLEVLYQTLGWIAFFSWSFSFYPQVLLNYSRKSVVGLNFDFLVLNMTKHTSYLIYNAALYFSPVIQRQYHEKYGFGEVEVGYLRLGLDRRWVSLVGMIPVAANDVAFSIHAVLLTAFTIFQVLIYDRGTQKVSKTCTAITSIVWVSAVACAIAAWPSNSWLWLISVFNTIQVVMTAIKYIPQETVFFDLLFIFQHYVLYPVKTEEKNPVIHEEVVAPLLKPSECTDSSNGPSNV